MRLLYVSHSLPVRGDPLSNVGGMQRVAAELHAALACTPGVELHPLLLETSWRMTHVRTPLFLAGALWHIPRLVRRHRIDVILFSSMVTAALAPALRRRMRAACPLLAAIPVGRDVTLPFAPYQRYVPRVLATLDLVLPISRATGEQCVARGLDERRMRVVPCGVDRTRFEAPAQRAAARAELLATLHGAGHGVPDDALLLCSVGRHQERKGFHWFVDAVMPRLPDDVVYLLAGSGPTTQQVEASVERRGLERRVRLLGRVDEAALRSLYRGADLFVMPNVPVPGDIEGFGVVMLEAGIAGLPVVAADLEGIRDVVCEGENGHLLPNGDAPAFAERIAAYRDDPGALAAASRRAAEHAARSFGWAGIAERHAEALRAALASAPLPAPPPLTRWRRTRPLVRPGTPAATAAGGSAGNGRATS